MATKKQTKTTPASPKPAETIESREQKLERLAGKRVTSALNKIRLIGNLAAYKPDDEQVDKICVALADAAQRVEARLRGTRKESAEFTL